MVTGDNLVTAKAIATEVGILTPGGRAMEGREFRALSGAQQREILPTLQVKRFESSHLPDTPVLGRLQTGLVE